MTLTLRALLGRDGFACPRGCRDGRNHHHRRHREQRRHDPHAGPDGRLHAKNPDIKVEWVTLEENVLRQNVTTDIATKGGQFDVMTIGTYEVPIWGKQGWLVSLNDLPADMTSTTCCPPSAAA
jgi:sorbitol/mannitol transport system substrate-binding protein